MNAPDAGPDLAGRKLILGITGGIAAYKTVELVRQLRRRGAEVQPILTRNAARFVAPLALATVAGRPPLDALYDRRGNTTWTQHVDLGLWADLLVIAPATAQTVAALAGGMSNSMLLATVLSARCPVLVCPSMDHDMYGHPATQANLERLRSFGYHVMDPAYGELASGLVGHGRMPEPGEIVERIAALVGAAARPLEGWRVLITAGPTREPLDPVRYLSNHSTGKMGYALAAEAAALGADVTLVSGPTALPAPPGVHRIDVTTADEMRAAAVAAAPDAHLVVAAAAVADYAPAEPAAQKIKKSPEALTLRLRPTPDVLAELGRERREGQILVGFALETERELEHAREKLERKNLDWIVLNNPNEPGAGFGHDTNRVTLLHRSGWQAGLPLASKREVARQLLARVTAGNPPVPEGVS